MVRRWAAARLQPSSLPLPRDGLLLSTLRLLLLPGLLGRLSLPLLLSLLDWLLLRFLRLSLKVLLLCGWRRAFLLLALPLFSASLLLIPLVLLRPSITGSALDFDYDRSPEGLHVWFRDAHTS